MFTLQQLHIFATAQFGDMYDRFYYSHSFIRYNRCRIPALDRVHL